MTLQSDSELRKLLIQFTARIPEVGIGEARNELEEKLEARDIAREKEIVDTMQKAKDSLDMDMPKLAKLLLMTEIKALSQPSNQKSEE